MDINNFVNTKYIKKALDQTKNDVKDSVIGTSQVIKEKVDKKFGSSKFYKSEPAQSSNNQQTKDDKVRNAKSKVDVNPKKEVVVGFIQHAPFQHQNAGLLLKIMSTWQEVQDQYLPKSCKCDWIDNSDKGKDAVVVYITSPQDLCIGLNFTPKMFNDVDDSTDMKSLKKVMLSMLPKMIVENISELEFKEQRGYNFLKSNNLDSNFKIKSLHDGEDFFIRMAKALSLIANYPELKDSINLHESLNAHISSLSIQEEGVLIEYYKKFIDEYNLTEFYPFHITYDDENGIKQAVSLEFKFARPTGALTRSINIYPNMLSEGTSLDNLILLEFLKNIAKLMKAPFNSLINEVKSNNNQAYSDEQLTKMVKDDLVFYLSVADDVKNKLSID